MIILYCTKYDYFVIINLELLEGFLEDEFRDR